jgi:hypothetical protein
MNKDIAAYNKSQAKTEREICNLLAEEINRALPKAENKIWHAHPVWFLDGNPIVGYSKLKDSIRLLFWSGQSFDEAALKKEGSFKAAEIRYTSTEEIKAKDLKRWLKKSKEIQWDYKNLIKRKGKLEKLKVETPKATSKTKPHIHYHKDGSIWAKGQLKANVMEGYWEWYRKDGGIMRSGNFKNGKQVGEWTTYDKKGKVYKVTKMKE